MCKLVRLISQNPIRVNVKLYYEIIGEENLRKKWLIWSNWKVLDFIGWLWEMGGTKMQLSPNSTNIFDFIDFYYKAFRKGESETKFFCTFFSSSRSHFSSPFSYSPKFFFAENFAAHHLFLLLRFVSWVSTLVLYVLWDDCWWDSFKSWEMFYCHEFMFVWYGISRIWGYLLGNVKE